MYLFCLYHFLSAILLSQFVSINIYRSSSGSIPEALTALKVLIDNSKPNLITGDLNLCFTKNGTNSITKGLQDSGFKQLVTEATHIQGGLIDHVYWRDERSPRFEDPKVERYSQYYSDHDALMVTLVRLANQDDFQACIIFFEN